MRSTIIPAQITTVEDKIAGNLTFIQLLLLMVPVLITAIVFIGIPPKMVLTWLKAGFVGLSAIITIALALRIKGKVVLEWLIIYSRYCVRPKYYIFNKNNSFARLIEVPSINSIKTSPIKVKPVFSSTKSSPSLNLRTIRQLEQFMHNPQVDISFTSVKRGGLHVAFSKVRD